MLRFFAHKTTSVFFCGVLLFLLSSACALSQQGASRNIAEYDHFIEDESERAPDSPLSAAPDGDSLAYAPKTQTYTKYKRLVDGEYIVEYADVSAQEMLRREGKSSEKKYINEKSVALDKLFEYRVPSFYAQKSLYNRIFQNSYADAPELSAHFTDVVEEVGKTIEQIKALRYKKLKDILPSLIVGFGGVFSLQAGYRIQEVANLSLPPNLRVTGSPDFQVNMNVKGDLSLGNKLLLPALALNNFSNFTDEIFKASLQYKGTSEEIIKSISLLQTNFNTNSSLIPSTQSLLGANMLMQFGRLFVSAAIGQVRSQIQTAQVQNGKSKNKFKLYASDYDVNQHFFLSQYFYENYERSLRQLPVIQSPVRITRIEIWKTNRENKSQNVRQGLGFMDLGEPAPYNANILSSNSGAFSSNDANNLLSSISSLPGYRDLSQADALLFARGLNNVRDYEKIYMRKLSEEEYYLNDQLGYIMLNAPLQSDEALAVAFEYSYNGRLYQVGEFSNEQTPRNKQDTLASSNYKTSTIFLKLLKATAPNISLPIWNLMMKNVYTVGYGASSKQDITFQILYEQPGGVAKNYVPYDNINPNYKGRALLQLTRMDALDPNGKPNPDGQFDFLPHITFIPSKGKIVFPSRKPFADGIRYVFGNDPNAAAYIFDQLYDTIQSIAKTYSALDRYIISGENSSSSFSNSDNIRIGFNLRPGSVKVYSGANLLVENQDYIVDYSLGTLRILNPLYRTSDIPINIQYENNNQFNFRNYLFMGLRWDYYFKNKKWILGGTLVNLNETPFYRKLEYSNDPISNSAYQIDLKYNDQMPWLTEALSIFPGVSKNTLSTIKAQTEVAALAPGHSSLIGSGNDGGVFIDDFESARSSIDIKSSVLRWALASTPEGSVGPGNQILFPEASLRNDLRYGYNRARLSWYILDPFYQDPDLQSNPLAGNFNALLQSDVRQIFANELFPNRSFDIQQNRLPTFDMTLFPYERGPYNFDTRTTEFNQNGLFLHPENKWGGIMRSLDQVDFISTNIESLEFWVMDPFQDKPSSLGGNMYIQIGNISEDILKDGNKTYENGLSTPTERSINDTSAWGKYPANPNQLNFAFNNITSDRPYQDVGLDGLSTEEERIRFEPYLNQLATNFGLGSAAYQNAYTDPSSDNYRHYSVTVDEFGNESLISRYKKVSNPDGNTPTAASGLITGSFAPPDAEDLNKDNVLNETESYFQYRLDLRPNMQIGNSFVVDMKPVQVQQENGSIKTENWYLFRIPLRAYQFKYGNIDNQSIRFIRLFLTGFRDTSITFRFATFQFNINQWRIFSNEIDTIGGSNPQTQPQIPFALQTVNIEENERKTPVNYVTPPGVQRQTTLSPTAGNYLQNEQSLSLKFDGLGDGMARAVFKNVDLDLRNYGKVTMFVHAEGTNIRDNQAYALIRLGSDVVSNYYEIRIPLKITPNGALSASDIWPAQNNIDIELSRLSAVKTERDLRGLSSRNYYARTESNGSIISIMGDPSLGEIKTMMMGVYNSRNSAPATGEIWFDELRLSALNENASWATTGNITIQMADLMNINVSGSYKSIGWGSLEQRLNQRMQEDNRQISLTSNIHIDKMTPKFLGLQLPMYVSVSEEARRPKFYPYSSDLLLSEVLRNARNTDSILDMSINYSSAKRISFPAVVFFGNTPKWFPLSPSLFTFNYTYSSYDNYSPQIKSYSRISHQGGIDYLYNVPIGDVEPFKSLKLKSPSYDLITKFNFRFLPSSISLRLSFDRLFSKTINRNLDALFGEDIPYFDKYFQLTKELNLRWALTRSLNLNYYAKQQSFAEEPYGDLNTPAKLDSFWSSVWSLGRNSYFTHSFNADYTLPFNLVPALNWISAQILYNSTYSWTLQVVDVGGDIVNNTQRMNGSVSFNLNNLYFKFLGYRRAMNARPSDPLGLRSKAVLFRFLSMVKNVNLSYTENSGTVIPGWSPNAETWGKSFSVFNPGLDFVFGYTPSLSWFENTIIRNNWIISNPQISRPTTQTFAQSFSIQGSVSPIRDLQIELVSDMNFTKNMSLTIKDVDGNNNFQILDRISSGSFSTSYISFTLFNGLSQSNLLDVANRLDANRRSLSERLATANPYADKTPRADGYYRGYDLYAQDVLLPAFVAAFTNTSPYNAPYVRQSLSALRENPFTAFPMLPNWQITYSGLTRIPAVKKLFSSLSLTHKYSSRLEMSNYTSSLKFSDPLNVGWPSFLDPNSGNFIPYFLVPNISLTENYDPLIQVSGVFLTKWQFSFSTKRTRQSTLSLSDYQISEANIFGIGAKIGWTSNTFELPFSLRALSRKPSEGNLTLNADVAIENNKTQNIRLDENVLITAGGLDRFDFNFSVGLIIDRLINTQFYFQQLNTYPQLSSSPPVFITRFGLRFVVTIDYNQKISSSDILKETGEIQPIDQIISGGKK